ncbi:MAG: hypothetical protein AABZ31_04835 [Bdellovibrionota bacterium]
MKLLIFVLLSVFVMRSAFAAEPAKKNVQYRKTQEVSFEASDVEGAIRTPDGAYVNPKKSVKFMPLYKIDQQFDRDIKDSVEYLK